MTVLPDTWWKQHADCVTPFVGEKVRQENGNPVISYGLSSFGYDVRLGSTFLLFSEQADPLVPTDPVKVTSHTRFLLPPRQMVLAQTYEYVRVPSDVLGVVYGKSTYARLGLIVNTTPLEPGWEGVITLCLINPTMYPIVLHVYQGIAQVVFFQGSATPQATYQGLYQRATEAMTARVGMQKEDEHGR